MNASPSPLGRLQVYCCAAPCLCAALCLISFFAGCTSGPTSFNRGPTTEENSEPSTTNDTIAGNTVQLNEELEEPSDLASSSNVLSSFAPGALGIEYIDSQIRSTGATFNRVVIQTGDENAKYKTSRLNSPERVVLDVLNSSNRIGRMFDIEKGGLIDKIRVGAHADKSRIVLDLNDGKKIKHDVKVDGGNIIVTVAEESILAEAVSFDYRDVDSGRASPRLDGSSDEQIVAQLGSVDEQAPPSVESLEISNDTGISSRPKLIGLSLESFGKGINGVVAEVTSAGFFTLSKSAPSEYVLKIENAELDPAVTSPIISSEKGQEIRSVRATTEGNDVLLRIFASPNSQLNADARGGKIVISSDKGAADYLAQPSPEVLKTPADAAKSGEAAAAKPAEGAPTTTEVAAKGEEAAAGETDELAALLGEDRQYTGRLISLDLQDTDIDNALRIIAEVSNLNIIASDEVTGKVTLRLIDVPWDQALDVILRTNGLDKVQEGNVIRIAPVEKLRQEREQLKLNRDAQDALEELKVSYIRISYARAADMKPLVEGVVTERGSVSYDERTNQLIVKDISRGRENVYELVKKLDLRTPQVLLETQIVEANRKFFRDLGSQLGYTYIQSPATGNATGSNWPNSITTDANTDFGGDDSSTLGLILGSADGTKALDLVLTAAENDGRLRVISRPAVATTNNKQAVIKSVTKLRVKTPDGGVSVATGQGAANNSGSAVATETIEVGIILEVTPQASPDYFVLLDVNAKSSTLDNATNVDGIPAEIERSTTSTVLVSSGQTFAMGGIYKISDNDFLGGVPFLKDVPVLGTFFRRTTVDNSDEELLFFITPRIVEGSFDDAAMKVAS